MTARDDAVRWLQSEAIHAGQPFELTEGLERCIAVLAALRPLHNLPTYRPVVGAGIIVRPNHLSVLYRAGLSTFDGDGLTRLVIAAHHHAVRASLSPWYAHEQQRLSLILGSDDDIDADCPPPAMQLDLHARTRSGSPYDRHPTIEHALTRARPT